MPSERVVADTHVLLWWLAAPDRLSTSARRTLDDAASIAVSSITFWEVGMLAAKARIELDRPPDRWVNDVIALGEATDIPVTAGIAVTAAMLADFHGDPADRLITATAIQLAAPLVTKDRLLRDWGRSSGAVATVW